MLDNFLVLIMQRDCNAVSQMEPPQASVSRRSADNSSTDRSAGMALGLQCMRGLTHPDVAELSKTLVPARTYPNHPWVRECVQRFSS